jgi:hypothetical protein
MNRRSSSSSSSLLIAASFASATQAAPVAGFIAGLLQDQGEHPMSEREIILARAAAKAAAAEKVAPAAKPHRSFRLSPISVRAVVQSLRPRVAAQ